MLDINSVDHLNMWVNDIEESVKFYKKVFNFKEFESGLGSNKQPYKIIGIPGKMFLCLYQKRDLVVDKNSLNHFGIHINNLESSLALLKQSNIEVLYDDIVDYGQSKSIYIKDPSGHEIELSSKFGGGF